MATLTHLDTHVLAWLYAAPERLSDDARDAVNEGELAASPMAILELTYLREVGRLRVDGPTIFSSLREQLGLRAGEASFGEVIAAAHEQSWTRDPFDRLIAAQAITERAVLVTKDEPMRVNVPGVVW